MLRCLSIADFKPYHLRSLDEESLKRIREHLSSCDTCSSTYDQFCHDMEMSNALSPLTGDQTLSVQHNIALDTSPSARAARHFPRIDGYQITGKLGQGGMGVVYRAVQIKLDRVVALKVLPAIVADEPAVARFRREAKAAARLHHTNIVPIYDFGESHDGHYYAMELIEGKPLNEFIHAFATQNITVASPTQLAAMLRQNTAGVAPSPGQSSKETAASSNSSGVISSSSTGRGRAYFRQMARWMADAAEGLHYAHGQGIIHRDIKPGNMILSVDGRIMITDFGLAKTTDDTSISVVGALIGAIRYLSPEQAMAGRLRLDHRTDIWSLGATLYELLTFSPAFPGTDEKQILSAIITKDPVPPRKLDAHVPAELETICLKTLEKDPDHRYATGHALAEDLQRWLDDVPIVAKRPGNIRRVFKYAKRNRAISTAVIAGLVMIGMIWGYFGIDRAWKVDRLIGDAKFYEKEGEWAKAEQANRQARDHDPNNAGILFNLSRSLQEQYDRKPYDLAMVEEAVEFCEKARRLDPKLLNIDNTYGVLLSMAKRFDDAKEVFRKNLPENGPAAHVWNNIAAVYFLDAKDKEALDALKKAIDKPAVHKTLGDESVIEVSYFHGYHELATLQLLRRDPEALTTIEQGIVLQAEKKHFGFYLVKARILLTLPDAIDALHANSAAEVAQGISLEKAPDRYIERYLALSHLRLNQVEKARTAIARSRDAQDLPVFTNLLLALAEAKSGNADLAQAALDEADRVWPADLKEPRSVTRSRHLGMIWFESADELYDLRREVEKFL